MRRKVPPQAEPPASLRVFNSDGLHGSELRDAFARWSVDREYYVLRHGWPGGRLLELQQQVAVQDELRTRERAA